jgi:AcrR family transcriptional regulator
MAIESVRRQAKRAELLKVAADQFLAQGYEGLSLDTVIARVGGTKSNVYTLFGNKARLFQAVVDDLCRHLANRFEDLQLSALPPDEALRAFGRRYLSTLLDKHGLRLHRLMIAEARRFPSVAKRWYRQEREAAEQVLVKYLQAQPRARLAGSPEQMARLFLNALSGELLLRQLVNGGPPPSTREINTRVDEALAAVLAGTSRG